MHDQMYQKKRQETHEYMYIQTYTGAEVVPLPQKLVRI